MFHRSRRRSALLLAIAAVAASGDTAFGQDFTSNEAKGARISGQWRGSKGLVTKGADGKVIFLFGEVQPSVVCSPLQVCDIELQAGEVVRDVLVGDTVRWKVEPATSGPANGQAVHLVIKPSEPGLVSSMVVTTSRRTYHIQLKSAQEHYMARVGFEYPEDVNEKFKEVNSRLDIGSTGTTGNPENLNFSYKMSGRARWKPSRVYSDGEKTYIHFPASLASRDAPVLFVVSGGQNRIVNYRLKGSTMVVDYSVDKAILVSGVGWKQEKITITRGG